MTSRGKVVVIGQGYVGLPMAMRCVDVGYDVIGLDLDEERRTSLKAGSSYIEDVSDEHLAAALCSGRYTATGSYDDCAGFDVAVITVPTPLRDGAPDLTFIEDAGRSLAPHLTPRCLVVLESTTYPGTTEELLAPILEAGSGLTVGHDFHLGYSPERVDPGNRNFGLGNTPKVVSGVDPSSAAAVRDFYARIVEHTVPVSSCKVAELTKLLENTFRHVNIALINEIAIFAHELGIDVWQAIDAASTKPFGYMRFTPGPGVGGHCLPIDPSYLAWRVKREVGTSFRFVELANEINQAMPEYVVRRITGLLNERGRSVNGSRILLLGLAYKRNTSDARESPSLTVARRLVDLGAVVEAADPHVAPTFEIEGATRTEFTPAAIAAADLVVVLTDHDAFDYELLSAASAVLDTRHIVPGEVERL